MRMIAIAALLAIAGCTTNQTMTEQQRQNCGPYERGRLAGLRAGAKLNPPDPATEHGRKVIEETEFLSAVCDA